MDAPENFISEKEFMKDQYDTSDAAVPNNSATCLLSDLQICNGESESKCLDEEKEESNELDNILASLSVGCFHWRMLVLVGWGYFAVCSQMMLFIFLSSPVKKEWGLEDMDFPWLPFR